MTRSGLSGILTGCFEDYMEFREEVEVLRAEAKAKKNEKKKRGRLSEEILMNAVSRLQISED